ncbi:MAG: competence protein CoiA family protein [Actinomycetota bacterium]
MPLASSAVRPHTRSPPSGGAVALGGGRRGAAPPLRLRHVECPHPGSWRPYPFCIDDVRCPSCSRRLVLRSGPAVTPHFAHRPRQSCRKRSGRAPVRPLRLEQLTLLELEPEPIPAFYWEPAVIDSPPPAIEEPVRPPGGGRRHRRRRRAWLPRLVRWIRAGTSRAV